MSRRDYSNCYAVLGVTPDTEWEALRGRYKRLMGQWHPDRFSGDTADKAVAEERSKEITLSYKALEKYRRAHGVLPPLELKTVPASLRQPDASPNSARPSPYDQADGAARESSAKRADPKTGNRAHTVATLVALVAALAVAYFAFDDSVPEETSRGPQDAAAQAPFSAGAPTRSITVGSTLGEVYEVQGIPTSTEGDTWHYGKSQIRFLRGRVVSWEEHSDNRLRVSRTDASQFRGRLFTVGTSKDEVRALQGTPATETDTVWDYTWMRVYFEHNHVTRWVEFTPPQEQPAR
jgi:outer membrane protein assembly factor BamE (lipoprotein component of BamABCDE complex)